MRYDLDTLASYLSARAEENENRRREIGVEHLKELKTKENMKRNESRKLIEKLTARIYFENNNQ